MGGSVVTNVEELAEAIGSYIGMVEGLNQREYMDNVLTSAHTDTSFEFNKAAAAKAMQDKSLSHMWEYGTAGITRGKTKFANPTAPKARLWKNQLIGTGTVKTVGFIIRPAVSQVPAHDPAELGIDEADMPQRLAVNTGARRYKFANKATVFESGMVVNVVAKKARYLFVPIKTEGMPTTYRGNPQRGFVWAKTHSYSPGEMADSAGRFTGFFGSWWAGIGSEMMGTHMMKRVERDLIQVSTGIRPGKKITKAQAASIKNAVERGKRKTRKQWTIKVRSEAGERATGIL